MKPRRGRYISDGRVWPLVNDHYTIRRKVSGCGILDELLLRRREDNGESLRQLFATMARELRALQRE